MKSKTYVILFFVVASIVIVLVPFCVSFLSPWSEINCTHTDVNLETGKIRTTRFFWYVKIHEDESDISVSKYNKGTTLKNSDKWLRVSTLSFGSSNSPNYDYHSVLSQIRQIELLFDSDPDRYSEQDRIKIVSKLYELWDKSGDDDLAEEYVLKILQ